MSVAASTNQEPQQPARVPPQSMEAETCVLGAMILDRGAIDVVVQILPARTTSTAPPTN